MRERDLRKGCLFTFLVVVLLVSVAPAWASIAAMPEVRIEWSEGGFWEKFYSSGELTPSVNDSFTFSDSLNDPKIQASWSVRFKSDPYMLAGITVINPTNILQAYSVTFITPVDPSLASPTLYGGSTGGTLTTDSEGGTISTIDSAPLYLGMVDGSGMLPLYPHESSWSKDRQGTTDIPSVESGLPASLPGGEVIDTIAIQYNFSLTPGDAVAFTGYFEVVPEPATLALLGLGGMVILGRKRR